MLCFELDLIQKLRLVDFIVGNRMQKYHDFTSRCIRKIEKNIHVGKNCFRNVCKTDFTEW
jgi:hypothetical protein